MKEPTYWENYANITKSDVLINEFLLRAILEELKEINFKIKEVLK